MPPKRKPQEKPVDPPQRSVTVPNFLIRYLPAYQQPQWTEATRWRAVVRHQPIAIACRDTLIAFLLGTEWQIRAKNPNETENYKNDIDYYMELFESFNGWDFDTFLDILCQDILDTPFGGAAEVGRLGDKPDGRTVWVQHIDAATLYPTGDFEYPVAQKVPQWPKPIFFPRHAIDRAYYSPRPEWDRRGWGMAPPEKIYLAIELLYRGDRYYANLLLDTPEAGVLDLLDMEKGAALEWLESFNALFSGADPFKVPILYEHSTPAEFIPFGRPPTEMIFDNVTFKYAQIVCAGYGMKVSDIGLSREEARTLAGVIRSERQTRRTGFANIKAKTTAFFNRLLPPYLTFEWLDQDDESMMARGRSRLANFQAYGEAREKKLLALKELRAQIAADGLLDIQLDPDDPEALAELQAEAVAGGEVRPPRTDDRDRVPPSEGGEGQYTFPRKSFAGLVKGKSEEIKDKATTVRMRRLIKAMMRSIYPHASEVLRSINSSDVGDWVDAMIEASFGTNGLGRKEQAAFEKKKAVLDRHLEADPWWKLSFAEEEINEVIESTSKTGYELAAGIVARALYEEGRLTSPEPVLDASLEYGKMPSRQSILEQVETANIACARMIKAATMASVCRSMAMPTVYRSIVGGIDVEDLLSNDDYLDEVALELRSVILESLDSRLSDLAEALSSTVVEEAASALFAKIGLKKGDWVLEDGSIKVEPSKLLKLSSKKIKTLIGG